MGFFKRVKQFLANFSVFGKSQLKTSKNDSERLCKVTGVNISMQKSNSILLSHTGLKYYLKTDPELFEDIKRKFLSEHWEKASLKIQIKEIAHNIRSHYSSMVRHHEKLNDPSQYSLFEENS